MNQWSSRQTSNYNRDILVSSPGGLDLFPAP